KPRFDVRHFADDAAALAFVKSMNEHRRHLTPSQRAMDAARQANMRQGERTDLQPSAPGAEGSPVSLSQAAADKKVSPRLAAYANAVLKSGSSELVKSVDDGIVPVKEAFRRLRPGKPRKPPRMPVEAQVDGRGVPVPTHLRDAFGDETLQK